MEAFLNDALKNVSKAKEAIKTYVECFNENDSTCLDLAMGFLEAAEETLSKGA